MVTPLTTRAGDPPGRSIIMGNTVSFIGAVVFVVSALTMVVLWVRLMIVAMGWFGLVLGVVTSPIAVAYPFLHWIAHSDFPALVFGIWLTGLAGLCVTMAWASWGRYRVTQGPQGERRGGAVLATDETD